MSSYLQFQGQVRPMEWGKYVYTVLPLPDEIANALKSEGAWRVEGEINDHPVNLALRQSKVTDRWSALTPGKQRGLLHPINTARRAETRAKRIAKMIVDLP